MKVLLLRKRYLAIALAAVLAAAMFLAACLPETLTQDQTQAPVVYQEAGDADTQ